MDARNYAKLNDAQRQLCDGIRDDAVQTGRPVGDLLLLAEVSKTDRAAIADAFVDGAGTEYLT